MTRDGDTLRIGEVTLTRVVEWTGDLITGEALLPDSSRADWEGGAGLQPDFWRPDSGIAALHLQSWVVRSDGLTVVVDTGEGDDRERPQVPTLAHLRSGYLEALAAAGVRPEDVDVVVNTHVHHDHVGWNTRLEGDAFVPTFPGARYLVPEADLLHFHPDRAGLRPPVRDAADRLRREGALLVYADAVQPVVDAGLVDPWGEQRRLDAALTLEAAPGHTPGSGVLWIRSGGESAVLVGDLLHTPMQLAHPDWSSCFCEDAAASARSRRRVLEQAADEHALVVPAHLPGHGAARIERSGSGFVVAEWADLAPA